MRGNCIFRKIGCGDCVAVAVIGVLMTDVTVVDVVVVDVWSTDCCGGGVTLFETLGFEGLC